MVRARLAVIGLVLALLGPSGVARPGAAATAQPDGAWKLASTTVNPTKDATPSSFKSLSVEPGHVSWTFTDEDPTYAAKYDIRYDKLPLWLEADTPVAVAVTVHGEIITNKSQRFTGAAATLVINRYWDKTVGLAQNCRWVSPVAGTPPACDAPATVSGTLAYTPPRGTTTAGVGSSYDVTVAVLNCGACAVLFHYTWWEDAPPARTGTGTGKTGAGSTTTTLPAGRLPVIVLPGVAGTSLDSKGRIVTTEVWPFALAGGREGMQLAADGITPANGATITARDLLVGGGPLDQLANTYGPLLEYFEGEGYRRDVDLFTFPYDWRLDNATHLAALDRLVDRALTRSPEDKVVLVAHSMGGLIARNYVLSTTSRAAKVDTLVSLGTPYWGSPKVFYALAQGYTFENPTVEQNLMKMLVQNFPAAYQLLPQYKFLYDARDKKMNLGHTYTMTYPGVLKMPTTDAYQPDPRVQWSLNLDLLTAAVRFWQPGGTIADPRPLPVKHYVVIGAGTRTLAGYTLREDPAGPVTTGTGAKAHLVARYNDGDGTVPLQGLEITGATRTYYLHWSAKDSTEHGALPASTHVQELVGQIVSGSPPRAKDYRYRGSVHLHAKTEPDLSL